MKRLIIITGAVLLAASCAEQEDGAVRHGAGTPVVFEVSPGATKAAADYKTETYFTLGEGFGETTVNTGGVSVPYTYDGGFLVPAAQAVTFPADGSDIPQITVKWPADALRLSQGVQGALKDQTAPEAFFASDWLKATLKNVVPATVIPISFDHERCKITFTVTGENAGKKIKSLTVGGYKAYCAPDSNDAQLIYDFQYDKGAMPSGTTGTIEIDGLEGIVEIMLLDSPDDMLTGGGDNCTVNLNI